MVWIIFAWLPLPVGNKVWTISNGFGHQGSVGRARRSGGPLSVGWTEDGNFVHFEPQMPLTLLKDGLSALWSGAPSTSERFHRASSHRRFCVFVGIMLKRKKKLHLPLKIYPHPPQPVDVPQDVLAEGTALSFKT